MIVRGKSGRGTGATYNRHLTEPDTHDSALHLNPKAVDELLRDDWWREGQGLPAGIKTVWFGATPAGEAACRLATDAERSGREAGPLGSL